MAHESSVDWAKIEPHYRAGLRSLRDIGAEFDVSHTAITKHAKEAGWSRDLKAKIIAEADAKVSSALVASEVSKEALATEELRIEVESEVQARIRLAHRADITRTRKLVCSLIGELEHQTENGPLYEELLDLVIPVADPEKDSKGTQDRIDRLRAAHDKAMSTGGRAKTARDLAETLKTLVALESAAYGLTEAPPPPPADAIDPLDVARRMAYVFAAARTLQ